MQNGHWTITDNSIYYDNECLSRIDEFIKPFKTDVVFNEGLAHYEYNIPNYQLVMEFIFWYKDSLSGDELTELLEILQMYFKDTTENNMLIV